MDGGDVMMNQDEPGAVDNRLSLSPAEFEVIQEWKDGETYSLSQLGRDVKLRQISPGEFEVIPGIIESAVSDESDDDESNPAMDAMLGKYRA